MSWFDWLLQIRLAPAGAGEADSWIAVGAGGTFEALRPFPPPPGNEPVCRSERQ
jgi:hypothetical protein